MENLKEIEVSSKEITKENGEKFVAYRGLTKRGWLDLRFTKACMESLSDELKQKIVLRNFKLIVEEENLNISKKQRFDVIYVSKVKDIQEILFEKHLSDYFD